MSRYRQLQIWYGYGQHLFLYFKCIKFCVYCFYTYEIIILSLFLVCKWYFNSFRYMRLAAYLDSELNTVLM